MFLERSIILDSNEWAPLLKPYTLQKAPSIRYPSFLKPWTFLQRKPRRFLKLKPFLPAEAIITGIPRSGTSYLCRLLHAVPDCIVISEPTQIFEPLNFQ